MRYVTFSFSIGGGPRLGVVRDEKIYELKSLLGNAWGGSSPSSLLELIESGPGVWAKMSDLVEQCFSQGIHLESAVQPSEIKLHSPIPNPRKNVVCLGLNYAAHAAESAKARGRTNKIPDYPVFFTKAPTAVSGPYDDIPWDPAVTSQVDFEAEMGVIIGMTGKNIPREKALEYVFGYTIINDFSARDLQMNHLQWFKGKSLDGFCPIGPHVVTADEFGDPQNKKISLRVNGEEKQSSTTAAMIFTVPVIIEYLSKGMTLEPGDIISTGTPEGVGLGRTPPEYLNDGDVVETELEGVGMMRNRIVRSSL